MAKLACLVFSCSALLFCSVFECSVVVVFELSLEDFFTRTLVANGARTC